MAEGNVAVNGGMGGMGGMVGLRAIYVMAAEASVYSTAAADGVHGTV